MTGAAGARPPRQATRRPARAAPDQRHLAGRPAARDRRPRARSSSPTRPWSRGSGCSRRGPAAARASPASSSPLQGTSLVPNRVISGPIAADSSGTHADLRQHRRRDVAVPRRVRRSRPGLRRSRPARRGQHDHRQGPRPHDHPGVQHASSTRACARHDPWPAAVWASRRQAGCVRFCVLPVRLDHAAPLRVPAARRGEPSAALEPSFVTLRYGQPAYALLSGDCPMAVWTGADNGSQLGVYLQIQETEAVATSSSGLRSTCPRSWKAASSFTRRTAELQAAAGADRLRLRTRPRYGAETGVHFPASARG